MRIGYTQPSITELEVRYATEAVKSGWGSSCYEWLERFEHEFSKFVGSEHAIATSSCTGAMQLGLHALGIGAGDEVILADTNWVATLAPIVHLGATPVLVDIDPVSWCIDPKKVREAISPRTKAVIATHLYGNLCDMTELIAICNEFNIFLIEDAAEAIGSYFGSAHAGSMGTFGIFSFHGTKTMTTGEGGALVTNDVALASRVKSLNLHGRSQNSARQFWADEVGYKFRMSNVQAAIGVAQLERIDDLVGRKREILNYYRRALDKFSELTLNPIDGTNVSGAWMPNVVFASGTGVTREVLIDKFRREGIDARVFFWPLSSMNWIPGNPLNPNAYSIAGRSINLPSYHDITTDEQDSVVAVLCSVMLTIDE